MDSEREEGVMIRTYSVGFTTLGKIHIAVKDGETDKITSTAIYSVEDMPKAIGFLRDHLEEDAGCFVPRDGFPAKDWMREEFESMERSM